MLKLNVRSEPFTQDPGDPGWSLILSSTVSPDKSRLGSKVRDNLTSSQVATALPGLHGQGHRLTSECGRDHKGDGEGLGLAGPDLAVKAGILPASQGLSHLRFSILQLGKTLAGKRQSKKSRGLRCRLGLSLCSKILSLSHLDTGSGH